MAAAAAGFELEIELVFEAKARVFAGIERRGRGLFIGIFFLAKPARIGTGIGDFLHRDKELVTNSVSGQF